MPHSKISPHVKEETGRIKTNKYKFTFSFIPSKDTYHVLKKIKGKVKGNKGESKVARIKKGQARGKTEGVKATNKQA